MGLLDRAGTLDGDALIKRPEDPSELAGTIVSSFRHSPDHIDFPGEVFKAFQTLIGFDKGALMLPDNEGKEYYPWVTVGFDRTTNRRLRVPFDFPALNSDKTTIINIVEPDSLAQMLSTRESGLVSKILIVRMGREEAPSALLLYADGASVKQLRPDLTAAIQLLNGRFGNGIERSRLMTESKGEVEVNDLSEWLAAWGMEKATAVILDITDASKALVGTVPGLDLFRSRRDVINLLKHVTGRMGRLYDLKDSRVLLLFPPERLPDHDLYLHQLSLSFASAFGSLPGPISFPAEFRVWPEEKEAIEESLSGSF